MKCYGLDFSVSDSYFEECLILRLILAGCQDLLNDAILLSCNNFLMGFFISGLGMFKYRPKFLELHAKLPLTLLFTELPVKPIRTRVGQ